MTTDDAAATTISDVLDDVRSIVSDCETDIDRLHQLKRTVEPGEQRDSLLFAIDRLQALWAAGVMARNAMRDVTL